jgi:hypothetical protein
MPEFGNPFAGFKHDRKLTDEVEDIIQRDPIIPGAAPTPFNSFVREANMSRKVIFIDSAREKC